MNILAPTRVDMSVQPDTDVPWWRTELGAEEVARVVESIKGECISHGPVTATFEAAIGAAIEVPYVVCTTSGSMSLTLAMMTLGVGVGDEVIVPNRTFMATAHAALILGASVRLVDVLPDMPAMDTDQLESAISPRTKAIVAVHLNGRATNMDAINIIAQRHNIPVIEDAAQAFLSRGPGGWLGTQSDLGCFSLGMTKMVSTGQGGFVVTREKKLYDRMRRIQNHGVVDTLADAYEMPGGNFKFNDVLASIGLVQLERGDSKVSHVIRVYEAYGLALECLDCLELLPVKLEDGEVPLWTEVLAPSAHERANVMQYLGARGIQTRQFLPDLNRSAYLGNEDLFPNSSRFHDGGMFLPGGPAQPIENVHRTIQALQDYDRSHRP